MVDQMRVSLQEEVAKLRQQLAASEANRERLRQLSPWKFTPSHDVHGIAVPGHWDNEETDERVWEGEEHKLGEWQLLSESPTDSLRKLVEPMIEKLSTAHAAIHLSVEKYPGKKQVEEALAALKGIYEK